MAFEIQPQCKIRVVALSKNAHNAFWHIRKKTIKQNSYYSSFDNRLIHILAKLKYHNPIVPVVYLLFIVKNERIRRFE